MDFELYAVVCAACGRANRTARSAKFALAEGEKVTDFCWRCLDHLDHVVAPKGCLVVWEDGRGVRGR